MQCARFDSNIINQLYMSPVSYSDKLAHILIVINCRYSIAKMCTCKDTLAHYLGAPFIDDIMRYNTLVTRCFHYSDLHCI